MKHAEFTGFRLVNSRAQRWKYFTTQLDDVYCWNCKVSVSTSSNTIGKYALGKLELLKSSTANIWNTCKIQMSQKIVLSVQNGKKGTVHSVRVFVHSTCALRWRVVLWLIFWVGRKFQQNAKSVVCISTYDDTKFQDSRKTRTLNDEEKRNELLLLLIPSMTFSNLSF